MIKLDNRRDRFCLRKDDASRPELYGHGKITKRVRCLERVNSYPKLDWTRNYVFPEGGGELPRMRFILRQNGVVMVDNNHIFAEGLRRNNASREPCSWTLR